LKIVSGLVQSDETGITHLVAVEQIGPGDEDYRTHVLSPSDLLYPSVARIMAEQSPDQVLARQLLETIPGETASETQAE
jgi:hypothetical protein